MYEQILLRSNPVIIPQNFNQIETAKPLSKIKEIHLIQNVKKELTYKNIHSYLFKRRKRKTLLNKKGKYLIYKNIISDFKKNLVKIWSRIIVKQMIRNKIIIGSANVNKRYGLINNKININEFKKLLNFAHHYEYEESGLKLDDIKKLILEKRVMYDHTVDQKGYKWSGKSILKKIDEKFLPEHLSSNLNKYSDWLD